MYRSLEPPNDAFERTNLRFENKQAKKRKDRIRPGAGRVGEEPLR